MLEPNVYKGNDKWNGLAPEVGDGNSGPWNSLVYAIQKIRNLRTQQEIQKDEVVTLYFVGKYYNYKHLECVLNYFARNTKR